MADNDKYPGWQKWHDQEKEMGKGEGFKDPDKQKEALSDALVRKSKSLWSDIFGGFNPSTGEAAEKK